jgi:ATP synthase F1 delta subunit
MEQIAEVYARSLFEVAVDQGKLDVCREQLGQVADALDGNRDLATFFFSPYFSTQEKLDGLGRMLEGAESIIENLLGAMIENHRMPALFRTRKQFDHLWDKANQRLPMTITSAVPLDDKTAEQISRSIGEQTGQTIELTKTVDPEILGGLIVRVGNSIVDASIRNRLEQLRRSVARAA